MADPNSFDRAHGPGDGYYTYSNMNFPIVASVMERATGERFDRLMKRPVIDPLKLDACYNWPTCGDAALAHAVELDGVRKLSPTSIETMIAPVWSYDGRNGDTDGWFVCRYGLAGAGWPIMSPV